MAPDEEEPTLLRVRSWLRNGLYDFLAEATTAIWHGALIAFALLPIVAGLIMLWTRRWPAWSVFVTWILFLHFTFCFALGCVILILGARFEAFRYLLFGEIGQWYKNSAGLAVVGFCGLCLVKVLILVCPQLFP